MKLHLACGPVHLDGWTNIDLDSPMADRRLDLRRPLPYRSQTVSTIFCEHFIEHIKRDEAREFLRECRRVLAPDGTVRLSTPDLKWLVAKYQSGEVDHWKDVGWICTSPCQLLNEAMRLWGHKWVYDEADLHAVLAEAGFANCRNVAWRESEVPELQNLESRPYHHEIIVEAAGVTELANNDRPSRGRQSLRARIRRLLPL